LFMLMVEIIFAIFLATAGVRNCQGLN